MCLPHVKWDYCCIALVYLSCFSQGKGNPESPKVLDTIPDLFHWLHSNPHSIPVEAHSILEQYLNMASQQPDEQGAGLVGVVSIIKEAVNGKDRAIQLHLCEIMIFTQW